MIVSAPAKVNLVLRVGDRRADGYHELDSLVSPITLADELEIQRSERPGVRVTCSDGRRDTLVTRSLNALLEHTGAETGFDVVIEKRIPIGGGLGGGSSDAGRALIAANAMSDAPLAAEELHSLATSIGSDVPFFLRHGPARMRGRGERIDPWSGLPDAALLVANPGVELSTADVYAGYRATAALPLTLPHPTSFEELAAALENDLTAVAERLCPASRRLRVLLTGAGAAATLLAGSGASVFGLFRTLDEASAARELVTGEGWTVTATLSGG